MKSQAIKAIQIYTSCKKLDFLRFYQVSDTPNFIKIFQPSMFFSTFSWQDWIGGILQKISTDSSNFSVKTSAMAPWSFPNWRCYCHCNYHCWIWMANNPYDYKQNLWIRVSCAEHCDEVNVQIGLAENQSNWPSVRIKCEYELELNILTKTLCWNISTICPQNRIQGIPLMVQIFR